MEVENHVKIPSKKEVINIVKPNLDLLSDEVHEIIHVNDTQPSNFSEQTVKVVKQEPVSPTTEGSGSCLFVFPVPKPLQRKKKFLPDLWPCILQADKVLCSLKQVTADESVSLEY